MVSGYISPQNAYQKPDSIQSFTRDVLLKRSREVVEYNNFYKN